MMAMSYRLCCAVVGVYCVSCTQVNAIHNRYTDVCLFRSSSGPTVAGLNGNRISVESLTRVKKLPGLTLDYDPFTISGCEIDSSLRVLGTDGEILSISR